MRQMISLPVVQHLAHPSHHILRHSETTVSWLCSRKLGDVKNVQSKLLLYCDPYRRVFGYIVKEEVIECQALNYIKVKQGIVTSNMCETPMVISYNRT